ncbi:uncharacterized protein BDR25DRAFT_108122 [Lindgomyces ingoldianus]|uniref:Uncharacterized protein n=1 Tax=Lindgomyces ingoldianus TaxID=673940 RepID=A0ACB6Q9H3_9PLEO|nr:uncharacterized protein BDR25DRAFT_108122 [Lindgomyces ingoldianus]KAF2463561.1 hypothetical protein BDR25DRAFT_108122 [Lindgomyces ingoldianus]
MCLATEKPERRSSSFGEASLSSGCSRLLLLTPRPISPIPISIEEDRMLPLIVLLLPWVYCPSHLQYCKSMSPLVGTDQSVRRRPNTRFQLRSRGWSSLRDLYPNYLRSVNREERYDRTRTRLRFANNAQHPFNFEW